jgi:DNA-directed RNA polymerase specialized sigma24 family protein
MTRWLRAGHYTESEVQVLLDNYLELRFLKHRPSIHVRLMDLEVAVRDLPRKLREAVIVYGILRFDSRAAGEALHVSHQAVVKRYRQGLDQMMYRLNGYEQGEE